VRKRSWPAVSHYASSVSRADMTGVDSYDLELDRLAVEFDGSDFLRSS
jgi:hypothetical protein